MSTSTKQRFIFGLVATILAGCGGGGGDGGPPPPPPPPPTLNSALDFESPSEFRNGAAFVTEAASIVVTGEINSATIPRGICDTGTPANEFSFRWSNAASGESGMEPIAVGCVTIIGIPAVRTQFSTESFSLESGENRITFETFRDGSQVGRDQISIVREDNSAPRIMVTAPDVGQQSVPTNYAVAVVFNEQMDPASLSADRFVVRDDNGLDVTGQLNYDAVNRTWTFRPATALLALEDYTAVVVGLIQDTAGNQLGDDFIWTFATGTEADSTAPIVTARWPGTACDCAPVTTRVLVGFSEIVDPASLAPDSIDISAAGAPVTGEIEFHGNYLEFIPAGELLAGQTYSVTVSGAIRDLAGLPMAVDQNWQFTTDLEMASGSWFESSLDQSPPAMFGATAVWTGIEVLIWGHAGAGSFDPFTNQWNVDSMISLGGPSARFDHTAIWTGSEMLVWGGRSSTAPDAEIRSNGGAFNTVSNAWTDIDVPASQTSHATYKHSAVWTGTEMIVWAGIASIAGEQRPVASGWRYNPVTGISTAFTGSNPPVARESAHAVWTGTELIVWGGNDDAGLPLNDGARYDPVSDTWTPLPAVADTLVAGVATSAVWTGNEMLVWNGGQTEDGQTGNDRLRVPTLHAYDPLQNSWRVSESGWEPFLAGANPAVVSYSTSGYQAFWTGDRMFVTGFYPGDGSYLYDPVADRWQVVADVAGLGRNLAASVWAGSRYVIWGGGSGILPGDRGLVFQP